MYLVARRDDIVYRLCFPLSHTRDNAYHNRDMVGTPGRSRMSDYIEVQRTKWTFVNTCVGVAVVRRTENKRRSKTTLAAKYI
jgi:hypothetical protein